MQENDMNATRQKIIDILKLKGPSLPVRIASQIGLSSLFAGAFLSELAKDKIIKISNMKVGGSPLYFLEGQKEALEKFHPYMPGKEKEAFLLLRKNKILEDKKQEPAIRVALRNIKDFAFPFTKDNEIFWRFHSMGENEIRAIFETPKAAKPTKIKIKQEALKIKGEQTKIKREQQLDIGLKKEGPKKEKSDFATKVITLLQNNNIEVLEEREIKKKELSIIIRINSALGKIRFLCVAKDKKRITENDLRITLQKSQTLKMPALVIFPQDIHKKALAYAEKWDSLLKLRKLQ